jgi:hypothetical protein
LKVKAFLALCALASPAFADEPELPAVFYSAWDAATWTYELGVTDGKAATVLHRDLTTDFRLDVGIEPGTGRYAIAFDGDEFEERSFTYAGEGRTVNLLFGEIGKGIVATAAGDAACAPSKCYEARPIVRGDRVFTYILRVNGASLAAYAFGKADKGKSVFVRSGAREPVIAGDGKSLLYVLKDGVTVETVGGKAAKPLFKATHLLENEQPVITKERIYYRRREPKTQESMLVEAWDRKRKKGAVLYTLSNGIEWPAAPGMWWSEKHKLLVFADNAAGGRILAVPGAGGEAKELMTGARQVFGLSPDGRWLLVTQVANPKDHLGPKNPERLAVLDLDTGKVHFLANPGKSEIKFAAFR